jgi:hypothetical protein
MNHAYTTGLNKKVKPVVQLDKDTLQIINKFKSIASASRETGEPEHRISEAVKGKKNKMALYCWSYET